MGQQSFKIAAIASGPAPDPAPPWRDVLPLRVPLPIPSASRQKYRLAHPMNTNRPYTDKHPHTYTPYRRDVPQFRRICWVRRIQWALLHRIRSRIQWASPRPPRPPPSFPPHELRLRPGVHKPLCKASSGCIRCNPQNMAVIAPRVVVQTPRVIPLSIPRELCGEEVCPTDDVDWRLGWQLFQNPR